MRSPCWDLFWDNDQLYIIPDQTALRLHPDSCNISTQYERLWLVRPESLCQRTVCCFCWIYEICTCFLAYYWSGGSVRSRCRFWPYAPESFTADHLFLLYSSRQTLKHSNPRSQHFCHFEFFMERLKSVRLNNESVINTSVLQTIKN